MVSRRSLCFYKILFSHHRNVSVGEKESGKKEHVKNVGGHHMIACEMQTRHAHTKTVKPHRKTQQLHLSHPLNTLTTHNNRWRRRWRVEGDEKTKKKMRIAQKKWQRHFIFIIFNAAFCRRTRDFRVKTHSLYDVWFNLNAFLRDYFHPFQSIASQPSEAKRST